MEESEFGTGCTYNLALFLAHESKIQQFRNMNEDNNYSHAWFNGASDHLYELQIPKQFPEELQTRLQEFKNKVLDWGHGSGLMTPNSVNWKDVEWSLRECKDLLMEIDKQLKVKVIKGDFE